MKKMRTLFVILALFLLLLSPPCFAGQPENFIADIAPAAERILPGYGLWPSVFIAQSCLESGFGKSALAEQANNYFGRKCGYDPCIEIPTAEYRDGERVMEFHSFQVYGSLNEAVHDYAEKFFRQYDSGLPVYNMDASTPFTFVDSIAGKYASDPKYAWKVKSLIYEYDLQKYDQ